MTLEMANFKTNADDLDLTPVQVGERGAEQLDRVVDEGRLGSNRFVRIRNFSAEPKLSD